MDNNTAVLLAAAIGVIGSIIGGAIGGWFSLRSTDKAHRQQRERESDSRKAIVYGFLQAVHDEVETLWETYSASAGNQVEALGENLPLSISYPVTHDYFTVYNSNAFLLGQISDADLRKMIVVTYTKAKGLIDSYRMNNQLLQQYEYWHYLHQETQHAIHLGNAQAHWATLTKYANAMKRQHQEVKVNVTALLRTLRKVGVLSNNSNTAISP